MSFLQNPSCDTFKKSPKVKTKMVIVRWLKGAILFKSLGDEPMIIWLMTLLVFQCESFGHVNLHLTFVSSLMIPHWPAVKQDLNFFPCSFPKQIKSIWWAHPHHSQQQRAFIRDEQKLKQLLWSHLGLALLPIDNLSWNNLGGSGLRTGAHAFGLGDNHLGDGSRGCDDGWFGPLNGLQALLTLRKNKEDRFWNRKLHCA